MLTATEIDRMRRDVTPSLPDTVVISRPAWTADGLGGSAAAWAAAGTVACRVEPLQTGEGEEVAGGRAAGPAEYVVTVAHDQDVRGTDRLIYQGGTLEVTEVVTARSWDVHTRIRAVRS